MNQKSFVKNGKLARKAKALAIGHARIRLINQVFFGAYKLRAHAELPNYDFPLLTQGRPYGLKSFTQLCSACPSLRSEISLTSKGNLTLDESSGGMKMKKKISRTKEEVIKEIKSLINTDKRYLSCHYLRKIKRFDLLYKTRKLFGNWTNAVKVANFLQIYKSWSKTKVIKELKAVASDFGHSPSMQELRNIKRHDLLNAITRHFGKYNAALKKADLPIVLEMNKWPKRKVILELRKISRYLGKKPTRSEIEALGRRDLKMATIRAFGSWNKAMIAAGFTPNDDAIHNKLGQMWEHIVLEIASKIYPNSAIHFGLPNRGLPDLYVFDESLIIEAKINISENNVKSDTGRYLPYCKRLQIWYLYGIPPSTFSDKIELVDIDTIKTFINSDTDLKKEFKMLIREMGGKRREI